MSERVDTLLKAVHALSLDKFTSTSLLNRVAGLGKKQHPELATALKDIRNAKMLGLRLRKIRGVRFGDLRLDAYKDTDKNHWVYTVTDMAASDAIPPPDIRPRPARSFKELDERNKADSEARKNIAADEEADAIRASNKLIAGRPANSRAPIFDRVVPAPDVAPVSNPDSVLHPYMTASDEERAKWLTKVRELAAAELDRKSRDGVVGIYNTPDQQYGDLAGAAQMLQDMMRPAGVAPDRGPRRTWHQHACHILGTDEDTFC